MYKEGSRHTGYRLKKTEREKTDSKIERKSAI